MRFTFSIAIAALVGSSAAHMIMADPPQWQVTGESQGPLDPEGGDFPCQNGHAEDKPSREYTAGEDAILQVQGTAVHGGGSGQMLITYDFPPTPSSVWRVMTSFEGDHPFKAEGNLSPADPMLLHDPVKFNVPAGIPAGRAVVAWSWFNRRGNREMYMKCATVNIISAAPVDDALSRLPTLFRANSGGENRCIVPEDIDAIAFKNPGEHVVRAGYTGTTIDCDNSQPGEAGGAPSPSPTDEAPVPTATETEEPETPYPTEPAGGDDEAGNDDEEEPIATPTAAPTKPTKPTPSPTKPTPAPTDSPASGACPEGKVYCNDDGTWSMCGSGYIQKIGRVPPGMQCVNGEFSAAKKRSIRFSSEHMRHRRH